MLTRYDKTLLRNILNRHFTIDEIKTLCFDLGVDYENLAASTKDGKARELLDYLERCERVSELLSLIFQQRPNLNVLRQTALLPFNNSPIIQKDNFPKEDKSVSQRSSNYSKSFLIFGTSISWFTGHILSTLLISQSVTFKDIFIAISGFVYILIFNLFGIQIINHIPKIKYNLVARLSLGFLFVGLFNSIISLSLWSITCSVGEGFISASLGCNDTSKLLWRLINILSSVLGLTIMSLIMIFEFIAISFAEKITKNS